MPKAQLLLLFALLLPEVLHAQVIGRAEEIANTTRGYFVHARPGEATIRVHVMGTVPAPGTYEVPEGTSLMQVLALSGGMGNMVEQTNQRRTITLYVWRPGPEGQTQIFEGVYPDVLQRTEQMPALQENDVIEIRTKVAQLFGWRDGLSLGSTALSITSLIVQIMYWSRR